MIPVPSDLIVLVTVAAGSTVAAVVDLRTRRVPNALTMAIASVGLVLAASGAGRVGLAAAAAGCLVGLLVLLPGHLLGRTGGGDVKLMGAFGTLLGPAGILAAFLFTAIAGGVLALIVFVHRRRIGITDNRFAYAPAIAVGACLAAIGW